MPPGARRRRAHERGDRNSDPELEQNLRGHRRDSETDRELARKHRTSSAGHEAIDRADGPRPYPLTRSRMGPARGESISSQYAGQKKITHAPRSALTTTIPAHPD